MGYCRFHFRKAFVSQIDFNDFMRLSTKNEKTRKVKAPSKIRKIRVKCGMYTHATKNMSELIRSIPHTILIQKRIYF